MVRGLHEMRKDHEKKLQDFLLFMNEGKTFYMSNWHAHFVVINKHLVAADAYSLKVLKEMTSEEWRAKYASDTIHETPRIDFFR
jgi:hypothetical protein